LRLSSLGSSESRAEYRERLKAHLKEHEASLSEDVRGRIELNPLRAFDSDHEGTKRVMESAPHLLDHLSDDDAAHFAEVRGLLDGAEVRYEVDPTLVRGLDYYTRTVFEFTSDALGAQSGVGGGGRYDGLVEQLGGVPTPGMGWAAGVERILLAGGEPPVAKSPLDLFVALADDPREEQHGGKDDFDDVLTHAHTGRRARRRAGFCVMNDARSAGLTTQMELAGRSLKGQLGLASSLGARYVAIVGEGETVLKDMEEGGQKTIATESVVHDVLRGLRTL
jgi:histidyl-tRNA synthetase